MARLLPKTPAGDKGNGAKTVAGSLDLKLDRRQWQETSKEPPPERYYAANLDDVTGNEKPRVRKNNHPEHDLAAHCTNCRRLSFEDEEDEPLVYAYYESRWHEGCELEESSPMAFLDDDFFCSEECQQYQAAK